MKPDEGVERPTETDPYATRVPGPESLAAMAEMSPSASGEGGRGRGVVGVSREEFERALAESGFLDADGLRTFVARLPAEEIPGGVESLARALVREGKLTRYQAAALFQGKAKALLIGPYLVLDKLGSGGMGMVFKARLREGGPEVALKLLPPSASKHPQAVLRFRREARIMEQLDHPNIVSSHDIGESNGVHYLVMDCVDGRDLDRIVRSTGPMKVARAVGYVIQASQGLIAAHERGIVHRDIKPANLLLDKDGTVRVLDLGLARITQGDDSLSGTVSAPSLTQSGIIMGTVDFLPPEQSDDSKRADHRADIYSLGCTLYFLLTGKPPYAGDSIMQRLLAHHQKPIPSLREVRPDVPMEVDAIVRRMLAKSPESRPQSMTEVAESLGAIRASMSAGKSLRVFDDGEASSNVVVGSGVRKPAEDTEAYDLMTYVRSELLEPDLEGSHEDPKPLPIRKSNKGRKRRGWADLAVRLVVVAAAITVIVRFFPKLPTGPATVPTTPTIKAEPTPTPEPHAIVEAPKPKAEPTPPTPEVTPQPDPGKPPEPSLFDQLYGPPPPPGPKGMPPPGRGPGGPPPAPPGRKPPTKGSGPP